jgi:large subunit ribosomal protein L15
MDNTFMQLNTLKPAPGSKQSPKRVGRGIGCGLGKTCGRGHKGQKARAGGFHKRGFEGGQMPLQRRLPKVGFNSPKRGLTAEVRLHELELVTQEVVDLASLKAANIVSATCVRAKVIASGKLSKAVKIRGLAVTKGAKVAIEATGGSIES